MSALSSAPPAAAAAALSMRGDSSSALDRTMSESNESSPTLPPPKIIKKYAQLEVLSLCSKYGKSDTIKLIIESNYGPAKSALYKMFPKNGHKFDEATIRELLSCDEVGSKSWHDNVDLIRSPTKAESDRLPLAPISPNIIQTRQSTRKRKNPVQKAPTDIDKDEAENSPLDITQHLQSETKDEVNSTDNAKIVQSAINRALEERKNKEGVISIDGVDSAGRSIKHYFLPLGKPRKRKPSSSDKSRSKLTSERAKKLSIVLDFLSQEDDGDDLKNEVMTIFAEKYGFFYAKEKDLLLDMPAMAVMRDIVGGGNGGTNMICRIKSVLEKFVPAIRGKIMPSCLKNRFRLFDAADNDPVLIRLESVVVSKDETKSRMANHSCLSSPGRLLERMVRKDFVEGKFQPSEDFMSEEYSNKCVVSFNTDKSSIDLVTSLKLLNREGGNSASNTFPIAFTRGPLSECYTNLKSTHYSSSAPTKMFLQHLVDDRLFILVMTIGKSKCQCFVFLPTPSPDKKCVNRFIDVNVLQDTKVESSVAFDEESTTSLSPPQISIPQEEKKVSIRAVVSSKSIDDIVGVEIIVGGDVKYTHKLRAPMTSVEDCSFSAQLLQIQGHPPNDMKMGSFLNGICSNSSLCPCIACTAEKSSWKDQFSELVWNEMKRRGLTKDGEVCPTDPPLRGGEMSTEKCWEEWNKSTLGGTVLLSKGQDRALKIRCASVTHEPLLVIGPDKQLSSDPMHVSSGVGNRALEEMRKQIRRLEDGEDFMVEVRAAFDEVSERLKQLDLIGGDKEVPSLLAPLHKESCNLRRQASRAFDDLKAFETKVAEEGDEEKRAELEEHIEVLIQKQEELFEKYAKHASDSKYSHYCQLQTGLMDFACATKKFLNNSSKRPRGKLEYVFNKAIENLGGNYMPDHGGLEQTNGVLLNTLEHFDKIVEICVSVYPEGHHLNQEISSMFGRFQKLVEKMFVLLKCLKSQKKITLADFLGKLVDFIVVWDETFPDCSEFNKLHLLKCHIPKFVQKYEMCGRVSAESHESIHTKLEQVRKSCCKMVSTTQQNETLYSRALVSLKPGVAERRADYTEKATGKKRQKYNVKKKTRLQDQVDYSSTMFVGSPIFACCLVITCIYRNDFLHGSRGGPICCDRCK